MILSDFYNRHKGETCLIVGNGPNMKLTPPERFDFPSFGVNTIYRYEGWKPTYYVAVDNRMMVEDGLAMIDAYPDIPKFVPAPDYDSLQGQNFYRFQHRQGSQLVIGGQLPNEKQSLTTFGITYYRVMDAVMQIAWWMGFTTMLLIGVQHKSEQQRGYLEHFWGMDEGAPPSQPFTWWFEGYKYWTHVMSGVSVLNISEDTYVPEDILPRGDWKDWRKE